MSEWVRSHAAEGLADKEIATSLCVTTPTVPTHVTATLATPGARSLTGDLSLAVRHGLVRID